MYDSEGLSIIVRTYMILFSFFTLAPLNSYTSDPAKAQDAFGGCVEKSYMLVPKEHRSTMPIYLGATAGMRLVE